MMEPTLFFGLRQLPFQKSSRYPHLYKGEDLQQVESRLEHLKRTRGIGVITGNPGTGKTAAIREFTQNLNPALYKVIYLQMTTVSVTEFFRMMATELGLEPLHKKADLFRQIQDEIRYQCEEKKCVPVVIIDEAQYLSNMILRDLVLLLNFDMDSKDCCILIFSGFSSLNRIFKQSINEALRQRIIVNYHVTGLNCKEASEYIEWCLKESGCEEPLFSEDAIEVVWRFSQGSIRVMNSLLSKSMIEAAGQKRRQITAEIVNIARDDCELDS